MNFPPSVGTSDPTISHGTHNHVLYICLILPHNYNECALKLKKIRELSILYYHHGILSFVSISQSDWTVQPHPLLHLLISMPLLKSQPTPWNTQIKTSSKAFSNSTVNIKNRPKSKWALNFTWSTWVGKRHNCQCLLTKSNSLTAKSN